MSEPIIITQGLTKIYRNFWGRPKVNALVDLDLEIQPGEIFGLLGPNGSGKTTTVKLLLGLIFPTRGDLTVLGKPPRDVAVKARIGFLPEESYLYRFLNAEETLDFFGRIFKIPRAERRRRINALIEQVGLNAARKRALKEYSKGMARRIGLAQALINDPDLVILDEPTSGMDPIGTREVKDLILGLKERGKTVLLCSHLLPDVQDVCDRIAILHHGTLRMIGRLQELLTVKEEIQVTLPGGELLSTKSALAAAGLSPSSIGHPRTTLEDLFLRTVGAAARRDAARVEPAPGDREASGS